MPERTCIYCNRPSGGEDRHACEPCRAEQRAQVVHRGFTRGALEDAFGRVAPRDHWKNPITATCAPDERDAVAAAIEFYTGSAARFSDAGPGLLAVEAAGYYAAIGS